MNKNCFLQYKNNCHTDAIFVSLTNVFTCIFAGFSVFAMLGFMAHNIDVPVSEVVQSGPGLAFIAYPEVNLFKLHIQEEFLISDSRCTRRY